MVEIIKKSDLMAEDSFDYIKLAANMEGFVPCTVREQSEELEISYDLTGLNNLSKMKGESEEQKRKFLVNFCRLYKLFKQYNMTLNETNIYYDENLFPYVKQRDVYGCDNQPDENVFLYAYKCIAIGLLSDKYTIQQVLDSGVEIVKKDKVFQGIVEAQNVMELESILRKDRDAYLDNRAKRMREVSKKKYFVWKLVAIMMLLIGVATSGLNIYYGQFVIPHEKALVMANERFIQKDYVGCIDSVKNIEVEDMNVHTKYILAVCYATTESFKQEEITNIVSRLSINSNEKELEYWIYLGRLEVQQAQNLALALSDDKLLIYAYMKEIDVLENRTDIDGEEKKARLDTLNGEIEALGKKYMTEE